MHSMTMTDVHRRCSFPAPAQTVVCLRGGERGTCLGHPLFGSPLEVLRAQIFRFFDAKLTIHSYNVLKSRSQVSTLLSKGPLQKLYCADTLLSKGPQQHLQFEGNLRSKGPPTATEMCKYSTLNFTKGEPKRNCNVYVFCFQSPPLQKM